MHQGDNLKRRVPHVWFTDKRPPWNGDWEHVSVCLSSFWRSSTLCIYGYFSTNQNNTLGVRMWLNARGLKWCYKRKTCCILKNYDHPTTILTLRSELGQELEMPYINIAKGTSQLKAQLQRTRGEQTTQFHMSQTACRRGQLLPSQLRSAFTAPVTCQPDTDVERQGGLGLLRSWAHTNLHKTVRVDN